MKYFELPFDGKLTRTMIREYGEEPTPGERFNKRNYGIGRLKLKYGPAPLVRLYEGETDSIRAHFSWSSKGAIVRMRTAKKQYAIGLTNDEIESIRLTKTADTISPIPFFPFWILLLAGVRVSIARKFRISYREFTFGPITIELNVKGGEGLMYETRGEAWSHCLATFGSERTKNKVSISVVDPKD